jgi:hypothetical protein
MSVAEDPTPKQINRIKSKATIEYDSIDRKNSSQSRNKRKVTRLVSDVLKVDPGVQEYISEIMTP